MRKAIVCIAFAQKRSIRRSVGGKQCRTSATGINSIKSCKERDVLYFVAHKYTYKYINFLRTQENA